MGRCLILAIILNTSTLLVAAPIKSTPYNQPLSIYKTAPNGPGNMISWPRPDKDSVATTLERPLWFTTTRGDLTEVSFPYVDRVQTRDSYLVIRSNKYTYDERSDESIKTERIEHTLAYTSTRNLNGLSIRKTFYVHPNQNSIVIDYRISFDDDSDKELIFVHDPAAEQTSGGDEMLVEFNNRRPTLFAYQRDLRGDEPSFLTPVAHQAATWSLEMSSGSTGFYGVNSPIDSIQKNEALPDYTLASYGNVAGALRKVTSAREISFKVVLSFTTNSVWKTELNHMNDLALAENSDELIAKQKAQWMTYLGGLMYDRRDFLAESSIMILKSAEDKTNHGAFIAAPANPSIPWHIEAPEHNYDDSRRRIGDSNAGYRRVWPRDLYHKATAFLSVGDYATAIDVARWYKKVQLKDFRQGSWAQNMLSDGTPSWNAFQIDQTGFPIVLVYRLVDLKQVPYSEFRDMVLAAANFILYSGPSTDQDRWEENGGLSPNSLAVAVQGLLAAAKLETSFGDANLARLYRERAHHWLVNIKNWTLVRNGVYGQNYFPRLEIGRNGMWRPDSNDEIFIQNKPDGTKNRYREDEVLDGGFLEWIISGLFDARDEDFSRTLKIYDEHTTKFTKYGRGYFRYSFDSYGENHLGGIWPILSAERAIVGIERNENISEHLNLIQSMATSAGLLGEQDTLSVRPLEWSHAAYLILRRSERDSRSFYQCDLKSALLPQ